MIKLKKISSVLFCVFFTLSSTSCSRKNNPIFGTVDTSVTSVTLFIPQIDKGDDALSRIFVFVTDQNGNALQNFALGNFAITEGGNPGVPYEVGPVTDPLYLALAIDRSGSMAGSATTAANAAAIDLVNALATLDTGALVEFESTVTTSVDFTSDKSKLINGINAGVASGGTALYDAIKKSAELLESRQGRRLLIVLTDGADTASSGTISTAIDSANSRGMSVYTVGLGTSFDSSVLQQIATDTGGTFSSSATGTDLSAIFLSILSRFNNLTYIRYRRRKKGDIIAYINYGSLTGNATKRFD